MCVLACVVSCGNTMAYDMYGGGESGKAAWEYLNGQA
jgi:hypothetical protein